MAYPLFLNSKKGKTVTCPFAVGRALFVLFLLSLPALSSFAADVFFYQKLEEQRAYRNSCAQIFSDIRQGKPEDVGGVVRNLKYINVDYLLRDYDNALSSDTRKHYVDMDTVRREVETTKRELYCRIELAIYMKEHPRFAGPVYDGLLDEAYAKLEKTYVSAQKSLEQENFARALYAFDLIAPYRDAYQRMLVAKAKLAVPVEEPPAEVASGEPGAGAPAGPITQALRAELQTALVANPDEPPGAIARAAQVGAITAALDPGHGEK